MPMPTTLIIAFALAAATLSAGTASIFLGEDDDGPRFATGNTRMGSTAAVAEDHDRPVAVSDAGRVVGDVAPGDRRLRAWPEERGDQHAGGRRSIAGGDAAAGRDRDAALSEVLQACDAGIARRHDDGDPFAPVMRTLRIPRCVPIFTRRRISS